MALGGAGCVLEVRHTQHALGTNVTPGSGGWTDGGFVRYGGDVASLPGLNPWAVGSPGQTPVRGYEVNLGAGWKHARNNAAGNTPYDWYCGVAMAPIVARPPVDLPSAFGVWEFGAHLMLSGIPAANITRDCGMVCVMSANTSFANVLRGGVAAGNDWAGFGVVFNGLGDLAWIVKKSGAGGGAPLTELVTLGSYTPQPRPIPVKIRVYSATKAVEAKVEVYVDGIKTLTRSWGAGSVLPVAADATFSPQMGSFRPIIRAGQETATNVRLLFRDEYLKAAPTSALLD